MTEHGNAGGKLDERTFVQRRKTVRHVSMICGLGLAIVTSVVTYITFPKPSAFSSDRTYQTITLRQLRSFTIARETAETALFGETSAVQLSPNGKIVVGIMNYNRIIAFSVATGQQLITGIDSIPPTSRQFGLPVFSPDGDTFAVLDSSGTVGLVDIWRSAARPAPLMQFSTNDSSSALLWATPGPNKLMAYSYAEQPIGLVDINTGRSDGELLGGKFPFHTTFSPDGKMIAESDGMGLVSLWNVASRHAIAILTAEKLFNDTWWSNPYSEPDIDSVIFSPDSKAIACGSDGGIVRVWNVATRHNVTTFSVNGNDPFGAAAHPVTTLIFSPDGRALVAADSTGVLGIWNVAFGRKIATIIIPGGRFESVAFTKAGALLVATENDRASDHRIEVWTTGKSLAAMLPGS